MALTFVLTLSIKPTDSLTFNSIYFDINVIHAVTET